ncbi:hypothetical protein XH92_36405 [Bradyrhizobium sp. CCBAU 53421]|nr:hypothetical protein XH92_36405 [Bradyrhizobium sp. CCBAU 53421]
MQVFAHDRHLWCELSADALAKVQLAIEGIFDLLGKSKLQKWGLCEEGRRPKRSAPGLRTFLACRFTRKQDNDVSEAQVGALQWPTERGWFTSEFA